MNIYQNEHVTIHWDRNLQALCLSWRGYPSSENYRNGWLASLRLSEQYGTRKWLVDQSLLKKFNPEDLQWSIWQWMPQAMKRLGKGAKVAVVLAKNNQFGKLGADIYLRAASLVDELLESRYFPEQTEARKWLIDGWESNPVLTTLPWQAAHSFSSPWAASKERPCPVP